MKRRSDLSVAALAVMLATAAIVTSAVPARCQATQRDIDALAKASLIYIGTVRKDGNQSNNTPVWFTITPDHQVLLETGPNTWKAKRIRRGSPALIWIGAKDGPAFIGKAEITNEPAIESRIIEDYPQKYLMARLGYAKPTQEKFDKGKIVAIKVTPIRDLPDGFANEAGKPAPSLEAANASNATAPPAAASTPASSPSP
jgi:hypothetical protein